MSAKHIAIRFGEADIVVTRVTVTLEQPEYAALLEIAARELRNPADQLRYVLREELARRKLLPCDPESDGLRQEVSHVDAPRD